MTAHEQLAQKGFVRCHYAQDGVQCDVWVPTTPDYKPPIFCKSHPNGKTTEVKKKVTVRCEGRDEQGNACKHAVICDEDAESPILCAACAGISKPSRSITEQEAPTKVTGAEYLELTRNARQQIIADIPRSVEGIKKIEEIIREKELEIERLRVMQRARQSVKAEWMEGLTEEELRSLRGKTPKQPRKDGEEKVEIDPEKKLKAAQRKSVESIVKLMESSMGRKGAIEFALKTLGQAGKIVVKEEDFS